MCIAKNGYLIMCKPSTMHTKKKVYSLISRYGLQVLPLKFENVFSKGSTLINIEMILFYALLRDLELLIYRFGI